MYVFELAVKAIKDPRKAVARLGHILLSPVGNTQYRPFIVLSRGRTGSNLLMSLLNWHPHMHAKGEVFRRLGGRDCTQAVEDAFGRQPFYIQAAGVKVFYNHPLDGSCTLWNEIKSLEGLHVIHLKRKNILRTMISKKVAGITGTWVVTSPNTRNSQMEKPSIRFTVDELREGFMETRDWENGGDAMFKNYPLLSVYYEDLVNDRMNVFRDITDFLGVKAVKPKSGIRKQNSLRLSEIVENYDELKAVFAQTEWGYLFED